MYIFVSFQEKEEYYGQGPSRGLVKARLEEASGRRCLLAPYQEFDMKAVDELKPEAIAMSGFPEVKKAGGYRGVLEVLLNSKVPMICFCGSHQLIDGAFTHGFAGGGKWGPGPIRKIRKNEDFPRAPRSPLRDISEYFVAEGFFPVRRVKNDPIFRGLPRTMIMKCSHFCEIKKMPPGFELLASSAHCRIEMMRHKSRILYGTQFHPEAYAEPFLHGRKLLENFAGIVDKSRKQSKKNS